MIKSVFAAMLMVSGAALAQAPTDQEIADSNAACEHHRAPPISSIAEGRTPNAYQKGWESCPGIAAEYAKRQIAAKAKEQSDLEKLNDVSKRLKK